jgi:hypothetical protein
MKQTSYERSLKASRAGHTQERGAPGVQPHKSNLKKNTNLVDMVINIEISDE